MSQTRKPLTIILKTFKEKFKQDFLKFKKNLAPIQMFIFIKISWQNPLLSHKTD